MTTLTPGKTHPALDLEERERADYLTVVASMVFADDTADDRELKRIRSMCTDLGLTGEAVESVLSDAKAADTTAIAALLQRLSTSDLRYALLVDVIDIAYADDEIVAAEAAEIDMLADKLDVTEAQVVMLRRYVEARTHHEHTDDAANEQVAKGLVGAGIPAAALGIASIAGAPLVAGAGIAAALGVGSYMSVRWLFKRKRAKTADADS